MNYIKRFHRTYHEVIQRFIFYFIALEVTGNSANYEDSKIYIFEFSDW